MTCLIFVYISSCFSELESTNVITSNKQSITMLYLACCTSCIMVLMQVAFLCSWKAHGSKIWNPGLWRVSNFQFTPKRK